MDIATTPYTISLLKDNKQDSNIRQSAAKTLGSLGNAANPYIRDITNIFKDEKEDINVRESAGKALINLGNATTLNVLEAVKLLKDEKQDISVRRCLAEVLGKLGDAVKPYIQDLLNITKDEKQDFTIRTATTKVLGSLGDVAKPYIQDLLNFIKTDKRPHLSNWHSYSESELLEYLGNGAKPFVSDIANLFKDEKQNKEVRVSAVKTLGKLGKAASPYITNILNTIKDERQDTDVRESAAEALSNLGDSVDPYVSDVVNLFKNKKQSLSIRKSAIKTFGNLEGSAKPHIVDLLSIIKDKDQDSEIWESAIEALGKLEKLSLDRVIIISDLVYEDRAPIDYLRFYTYFVSGGDDEIKRLLRWVAKPRQLPDQLNHDEGVKTLEVFKKAWKLSKDLPELRNDLAQKIALVARKVNWQTGDVPLLQQHYTNLKLVGSTDADSVQAAMSNLKAWQWFSNIWTTILLHALFWLALVFAYPKSPQIQAIFFWNPWVRKLVGVGYVGFLLTWILFLRRKLFEPFQSDLHADAGLETFDAQTYFGDSEVTTKGWKTAKPIAEVIPALKGQIILQAESGLGKTTYLRYLMRQSKRIAIYLTAVECAQTKDKDVIQAIQAKLPVAAADADFLRSLIYSGAIDLYIDGLNEVNAEARAKIAAFVRSYTKGNIIVTTQPLPDWTPPSTARIYLLQPLRQDQIEQFLRSRPLPDDATIRGDAYTKACHVYLEQALDDQQPPNDREVALRVLSNPMDLDTVADMLAKGEQPDLFHLQAQLYQVVVTDYKQRHLGYEFPLKQVSEAAYQMRLNDKLTLPKKEFDDAIVCLERQRMVVSKQTQDAEDKPVREWYFRHDKLWEFFIAQTLLGSKPEAEQRRKDHMGDPRFRGVYLLLGTALPIVEAKTLMDEFVLYGANTGDHTVSDPLVQIVRSRQPT